MKATPYLHFNGNCRQAFEAYKQIFGGDVFQMTYGDAPPQPAGAAPPPEGCGDVATTAKDRIMHVTLAQGQAPFLMGSDMPPNMEKQASAGMAVALNCDDNAEAERVFKALAEGGNVQMPLAETFWAERFGMCVDRFGTPWLVNGIYKQP